MQYLTRVGEIIFGTSAHTRHFKGGHFCGIITRSFYFLCVTKASPNVLTRHHFVSEITVMLFHDAWSMCNCAFCHIWCGIYCSTARFVLYFVVRHGMLY